MNVPVMSMLPFLSRTVPWKVAPTSMPRTTPPSTAIDPLSSMTLAKPRSKRAELTSMSFFTAWFRLRPSAPVGVETIDCSRCLVDQRELADIDVSAPGTAAAIAQFQIEQAAAHIAVDIGKPRQRAGIAAGQFQSVVGAIFRQFGNHRLTAVGHR